MKKIPVILLLAFFAMPAIYGQIKIGDNPQAISPTSVLELESDDRVLVITRINTAQMDAIIPNQGAIIYNTDTQCIHYYDGAAWINLCDSAFAIPENSIESIHIINGGVNGIDIQDGSIGPGKLQNQSVTQDKLSENSVGAFAIDNDNLNLSDFNNDLDLLTISTAAGNSITNNAGAYYSDETLQNNIVANTSSIATHIAADNDTNANNEIQSLNLTGNQLEISGSNTVTLPSTTGEIDDNELITNAILNLTTNNLEITEAGIVHTVPLGTLAGTGTDNQNLTNVLTQGNDAGAAQIRNVADPTLPQDAATRAFVLANAGVGTQNLGQVLTQGNDGGASLIKNILDPVDPQDAATRAFVLANAGGGTQNLGQVLTQGNNGGASLIKNILDPVDPQDAATRAYVLATVASGGNLSNGSILIGGAGNVAQQLVVSGDATIDNTGNLIIANDAITTAKILDDNVTIEKINASATDGQVLTTSGTDVVWATPTAGTVLTDATIDGDGNATPLTIAPDAITTARILDDNVTIEKINASATDGQVLTTSGTDVIWAAPTAGAVSTDATIDGDGNATPLTIAPDAITTARILDDNVTIEKINASATDGQVLTTSGTDVVWATPTAGTVLTDATIDGDGNATPLTIAPDAITTARILDDNVTIEKINASATDGQVLTTSGTDVIWAAPTAGAVSTDATIDGDGNATPLTIAPDAITTARILDGEVQTADIADDNVTIEKINASATDGQVLTTSGTDVVWATPTAGTVLTDATIDGDGSTTDLTIAPDAITTARILDGEVQTADIADDNVTIEKINASATDGQVLTTSGTDVVWATPTAGTVLTDATIDGDGSTTDLTIAPDAITTARILDGEVQTADIADDNVTIEKINASATDGQVLTTSGTDVVWANVQNFAATDLTLAGERTHNMAGNNLIFGGGGDVAIGTLPGAPQSKLDVDGQIRARNGFAASEGSAGNPGYGFHTGGDTDMGMFRAGVDQLAFSTDGVQAMIIDNNQDVGIGVANPAENLHVAGNIRADGSFLSNDPVIGVPDYVFEKYFLGKSSLNDEYRFQTLEEIETFVEKNKHLPGIQTAKDFEKTGSWNITRASLNNLEKIEELFLHTIEQENKIKSLQSENDTLTTELNAMKKDLEEIKAMLKKSN